MRVLSGALLLLACFGVSACFNSDKQEQTGQVATQTQQNSYPTYDVGSEISYAPFEFKDELGAPMGFEVDLLTAIGKAAEFNVNFVDTSRKEVVNTLNNGKFDIWASALSVSSERLEQMDMSDPYIDFSREVFVLDTPENAELKTGQDFLGKKIAISKSSKSSLELATELTGSEEHIVLSDSFFLSMAAVYQGKAVGVLGDSRVLQYYQINYPEVKTRTIDIGEQKKNIAFAVKKGNTEVLNKINQGLASVKADGTYDKLVEKWFGFQNK